MSTLTAPTTSTGTDERVDLRTDNGDHERFAHYAPKHQVTAALIEGTPVQAICGKRWVPSRDPKRYPICPDCERVYKGLPEGPAEQ